MYKVIDKTIHNFWLRNGLVVMMLFSMTFLFSPERGVLNHLKTNVWTLLLYAWVVVHNRLLIEKALARKKYVLYGVGLIAGLCYFRFVMVLFSQENEQKALFTDISTGILNTIAGLIFYLAFKYATEQNSFLKNKLILKEMEQKYLISQLSPHFLFNTLNNIYSYSITDTIKTPELILKLSELMRYLIDFNRQDRISLVKEINFIENYLAFEQERLSDRCRITFEKDIGDQNLLIEPLLFFPLVENAFKHGTNTMGNCYVALRIIERNGMMKVEVENLLLATSRPSTHIGIENVKRRLELLYPGKHKLDLIKDENKFTANLEVTFSY